MGNKDLAKMDEHAHKILTSKPTASSDENKNRQSALEAVSWSGSIPGTEPHPVVGIRPIAENAKPT